MAENEGHGSTFNIGRLVLLRQNGSDVDLELLEMKDLCRRYQSIGIRKKVYLR